jgi:hypothetical protein
MADAVERSNAFDELNKMTKLLKEQINKASPAGKFDDTQVISLVISWTRVAVSMRGRGIFKALRIQLTMKSDPGKISGNLSRAQELFADLNVYRNRISDGNENDATFNQALTAVLDFEYDYRKHFKPKSSQERTFEHLLVAKLNDEEKM